MRRPLVLLALSMSLCACPPPPAYTIRWDVPRPISTECARNALEGIPGVSVETVNAPEPGWFQILINGPLGPDGIGVDLTQGKEAISAYGRHKLKYESKDELQKHREFSTAMVSAVYDKCH